MVNATIPTPMPAMSSAIANGIVPCMAKSVTWTGCVFCNMKMISTIAATQAPIQTAPARDRGVFFTGDPAAGAVKVPGRHLAGQMVEWPCRPPLVIPWSRTPTGRSGELGLSALAGRSALLTGGIGLLDRVVLVYNPLNRRVPLTLAQHLLVAHVRRLDAVKD